MNPNATQFTEPWAHGPDDQTSDETVVELADGWTIRSGSSSPEYTCGEYVRICRPDGSEYLYEDNAEWRDDPILVMGAIVMAASGYRPLDKRDPIEVYGTPEHEA